MLRLELGSFVADPAALAAHGGALLDRARRENVAILHAYEVSGAVLSLGRYHRVPECRVGSPVGLVRRLGGGRVAPLGTGFVGACLALAHRSALVGDDPEALRPDQVLNRCVRGLLGALERLGVQAFYPGRDLVTVDGRVIAALSLEVRDDGATLVEMALAVGRSYAEVTRFADLADPDGLVPIDLVLADGATSVAEASGHVPDLETIRAALAAGYADRLGATVTTEAVAPQALPREVADAWLRAGAVPPELDRHATARGMLGSVQVDVRVADRRVAGVRLGGDVIAPSGTIARLEAELLGASLDGDELRRRVRHVLAEPGRFVLGLAAPELFADLTLEAGTS